MTFTVMKHSVTLDSACQAADEMERVIGEVMTGQRKAKDIPVEPLVALIQFVRNTGAAAQDVSAQPSKTLVDAVMLHFDRAYHLGQVMAQCASKSSAAAMRQAADTDDEFKKVGSTVRALLGHPNQGDR